VNDWEVELLKAVDALQADLSTSYQAAIGSLETYPIIGSDTIEDLLDEGEEMVVGEVDGELNDLDTGIIENTSHIESWLVEQGDSLFDSVGEAADWLMEWLNEMWNNGLDSLTDAGEEILDGINSTLDWVGGAFGGASNEVSDWLDEALSFVGNLLLPALSYFSERLEDIIAIPAKLIFTQFRDFFFEEV
jgi:hypothetical protein